MAGDVRRPLDGGKWPASWHHTDAILDRCVDHLTVTGPRAAMHIIPSRRAASVTVDPYQHDYRADRRESSPPQNEWERHGPGATVEWSRHRGRILSVS
jgi:hypothetical protein